MKSKASLPLSATSLPPSTAFSVSLLMAVPSMIAVGPAPLSGLHRLLMIVYLLYHPSSVKCECGRGLAKIAISLAGRLWSLY